MFNTKFSSSGGRFDSNFDSLAVLKGEDGFSPIVNVTTIENGYRISITDKTHTEIIDINNGEDGTTINNIEFTEDGYLNIYLSDGTVQSCLISGGSVEPGKDGKDGVGIERIEIIDNDLCITLTDGTYTNLGRVVGQDGQNGQDGTNGIDGKDGRGITSITLNINNDLLINYTDGTAEVIDLPEIGGGGGEPGGTGKDGVGIQSIVIDESGNLIITLTNGAIQNLGNIKGQDGKDGVDGKTPYIKDDYWWIGDTNTNIKAKGVDGQNGIDGRGIVSIIKTGTSGLEDTYTITYTDNTTTTYIVTNGQKGDIGTGITSASLINGKLIIQYTNGGQSIVGNIVPFLELREDGELYTSLDGKSWTSLGKVVGADGKDGEKGEKGDPYTLTDDDKTDIVNSVIAALPLWEGGSY